MTQRIWLAAFLLSALSASAQTTGFQTIRAEDDAATRAASLLHGRIGGPNGAEYTVGGQLRIRSEHWENFGLVESQDDDFWLSRIRLHGDLRLSRDLRTYVEGISALAHDRDLPPLDQGGKRPIDEDTLDLLNAFGEYAFDVDAVRHAVRVGRQELQFGKQRLVSPADWTNTRRTFEGARTISKGNGWRVDTFLTRLVRYDRTDFNDGDSGQDLYGIYSTFTLRAGLLDLYGLGQKRDAARFAASSMPQEEERVTAGFRWSGNAMDKALDGDLEVAHQSGDFGGDRIDAWMAAAEIGYRWSQIPAAPRLSAGVDYATGDSDPTDGTLETFGAVYPLGHLYFGAVDLIGRQNIVDFSAALSSTPVTGLTARVEGHHFEKAQEADALYDAGGNIVAAGSGDGRALGRELDVTLEYAFAAATRLAVTYGRFYSGDAITTGQDAEVIYAHIIHTF